MDIAKRIIELREKKNMSTNKLANLAGITQSYLREIELGKTNPTVEKLSYICDALDVSLKEFFDDDKNNMNLSSSLNALSPKQIEALIAFLDTLYQK